MKRRKALEPCPPAVVWIGGLPRFSYCEHRTCITLRERTAH